MPDDLSKAIVNAKVISAIIEMLHIPKAITEKEYIDALTALMFVFPFFLLRLLFLTRNHLQAHSHCREDQPTD